MRVSDEKSNLCRVKKTEEAYWQEVIRMGIPITPDRRISETAAASLLGYQEGSFKNLRNTGVGPAYYNRRAGGSRVSYRLDDLAEWIESMREE